MHATYFKSQQKNKGLTKSASFDFFCLKQIFCNGGFMLYIKSQFNQV